MKKSTGVELLMLFIPRGAWCTECYVFYGHSKESKKANLKFYTSCLVKISFYLELSLYADRARVRLIRLLVLNRGTNRLSVYLHDTMPFVRFYYKLDRFVFSADIFVRYFDGRLNRFIHFDVLL